MLDPSPPRKLEQPKIKASQFFIQGLEITTSIILQYSSSERQAIVWSTTERMNADLKVVVTIEGTNGLIEAEGKAPYYPSCFTVYPKFTGSEKPQGKKHGYTQAAQGFVHEADSTALDRAAGKESDIMPSSETIRTMEIMDKS